MPKPGARQSFHRHASVKADLRPSLAAPSANRSSSRSILEFPLHEGHVWQRRFYDFTVWTERKRIEKLRYMHRNPVVRGLVLEPGQWPWSSFRYYAYRETGPVLVNEPQRPEMRIRKHRFLRILIPHPSKIAKAGAATFPYTLRVGEG